MCLLYTLPIHDETLGFLVTWNIAGNADTQQLVFGSILGEISTITVIIHLNVKGGSALRILQLLWNRNTFFNINFSKLVLES